MQSDLDEWLDYYNNKRPHSGKYCFGKTLMQTWIDSLLLAKDKLLNNHYQKLIPLQPVYDLSSPSLAAYSHFAGRIEFSGRNAGIIER